MNLILLSDEEEEALAEEGSGSLLLPPEDRRARHIVTVLRPEPGATVRLGLIGGGIGRARVAILEGGAVRLEPLPEAPRLRSAPPGPEPPRIEVLLAMPRPKVMMRLWAVLAQLGVRRVVLINAYRVEKAYFSSQAVDRAKYLPELLDGLEQAVCTRLPEVRVEMRFKPFVEDTLDGLSPRGEVLRLLCHPGEDSQRIGEAVAGAARAASASAASPGERLPRPRGVLLAVGPEGGWVDFELQLLRSRGFKQVTMGPRVLTTETAVCSLVTLAADALAQLQQEEQQERRLPAADVADPEAKQGGDADTATSSRRPQAPEP